MQLEANTSRPLSEIMIYFCLIDVARRLFDLCSTVRGYLNNLS